MNMSAKVEKRGEKNILVVEIEMQAPTRSASGKTLVVASTHGNQATNASVDGKAIVVGLNAYIRP